MKEISRKKDRWFLLKRWALVPVMLVIASLFMLFLSSGSNVADAFFQGIWSQNQSKNYSGGEYTSGIDANLSGYIHEFASREDYRVLYDYYEEIEKVASLYPEITKLHVIGESYWGLPIYALEMADNPGERDGRPETYHEALMHASEWPSGEIAMELTWHLAQNYGQDARVTELLDTTRVFISPVINPDGFLYSTETNTHWRKNRSPNPDGSVGTDLNRNYTYYFGGRGSPDPRTWRDYWGSGPYSEPEAQAMGDFTLSRDFITFLNGHTYLEVFWITPPIDEDRPFYEELYEKTSYWNGYGQRGLYDDRKASDGGGGITGFAYGLNRCIAVTFEYQKLVHPPYSEGFSAPGLDTDAFGMIEGHLIWPSMNSDHHVTHPANGMLIDAGIGETMPEEVEGNIALIMRSDDISHADQVKNALNAGAAGVVLYNDNPYWMRGPLVPDQPPIGVMAIRGKDGEMLADHLDAGNDINVSIVPDQFKQDTFEQLWERNFEAVMIMLEKASVYSSIVEGKVVDRASGEPVAARLEKSVGVKAPFSGIFEGGYMMHERRNYIDAEGNYAWHMLPSKQPFLETPPYEMTATACGHYPQTVFLAIDNHGEEHRLDFKLQPVIELQGEFALGSRWPVNSTVPFDFVTVDHMGRPVDMEDVTVKLFSGETEVASAVEGEGPHDIHKVEETGQYLLELSTAGLQEGSYELLVEFTGVEGEQSYSTELVLAEELVLEGPALITIPAEGQAEESYSAYTVDESGSLVAASGVSWSLEQPITGVAVDSATGLVTVESGADQGGFTLAAEAGGLTGAKEITLAGSELAAAITAAVEAIAELPGVVDLDDAAQVEGARDLVDDVLALGGEEKQVPNILKLIGAESKLAGLEGIMVILNDAVALAEAAIGALPETITLADRDAVEEARDLAGRAFVLGAVEGDISNLDELLSAEAEIEGVIKGLISSAETAIAALPVELTLDDESAVKEARTLVEAAVEAGLDESDIENLNILVDAEEAIEALYDQLFIRQSLFELGQPVAEEGMHRFTDYYGSWTLEHTIGGVSFSPLRMFRISHDMSTIGTPDNPRWAEYDIQGLGYEYMEGYVGTEDSTPRTGYPYDFQIYVDDQLAFHTVMVVGDPIFYRIDVAGAEKIKIVFWAENTVASGYANRPGIVEPQFLIPITQEILDAIAAAEEAINELPRIISMLDKSAVEAARETVDEALTLGIDEDNIPNLDILLSAEEDLTNYRDDLYALESLFELGDPGPDNYNGMEPFVDYDNEITWRLDRTIAGVSFAPLKLYSPSYIMTSVGTPDNPRWIEYDISGRGYDFVEGYVGTAVPTARTHCPNTFAIHVDGEPVFQVVGEAGEVFDYSLDLQGAEKIKFLYWAEETADSGYANRPGIVEPIFYIARTEAAVAAAEEAIDALPAEISPVVREEIEAARVLVNNALAIGAQPAEMGNLDELEAAEGALAGMEDMIEGISAAMSAIADLPAELTLQDEPLVREARQLIDRALALGAGESDIENLHIFEAAWSAVEALIQELFQAESLFELGDPGPANYQGMENFVDYTDPEYWRLDRTIGGASFSPLKIFTSSEDMSDLGTPGNPRRVAYDISGRDYAFMEGYAGITDQSLESAYPLHFAILAGGEPVFEALLEPGSAMFYRVDLWDVEQVEFRYWAEETAPSGHANCPGFVEPRFFTAQIDAAIAAAESAISELPAEINPLERQQVEAARRQVDNALFIGAQTGEIDNLDVLISAELDLEDWSKLEGTVEYALAMAEAKIERLPLEITLEDKWDVFEARKLVDNVLRLGPLSTIVKNIEDLEEAEAELRPLIDDNFKRESLFTLTPVDWLDGGLNEMSTRFASHDDPHWAPGRTVYNRDFGSLNVYNRGHRDLDRQEQWIEYDISGESYQYVEGYIGIWDGSSAASYPPRFIIFGEIDGKMEVLFSVDRLWRGDPAYHYFLDISNVDKLRFYIDAEIVSGNGWTNRMAIVEPQFYMPLEFVGTYGDINDDGVINIDDVIMVMQSVLGLVQLDETQQQAADVDGDGKINVNDVILIMQRVLGLIQQFPVEE